MKKINPYTYKRYPGELVYRMSIIGSMSIGNMYIEDPVEREIADLEYKQNWYKNTPYQSNYYDQQEHERDNKRLFELRFQITNKKILIAKSRQLQIIEEQIMSEKTNINIEKFDKSVHNNIEVNGNYNSNIGNVDNSLSINKNDNFFKKLSKYFTKIFNWLLS